VPSLSVEKHLLWRKAVAGAFIDIHYGSIYLHSKYDMLQKIRSFLCRYLSRKTEGMDYRHYKYSEAEIAYTVDNIKINPRSDPYKGLLKGKAEHQRVDGCIKCSEGKAVEGAHEHTHDGCEPGGHSSRNEHR